MRKVIQELLDSSISTSAISQGAGVPWTTVSDLRKGKTSNKTTLKPESKFKYQKKKNEQLVKLFVFQLETVYF